MMKRLSGVVLGFLICGTAFAQSLDDRVLELERRVEQLERQIVQPTVASSAAKTVIGQPDGWRHKDNWRLLKRGMSEDEVRSILGEPRTINTYTNWSNWNYPGAGSVSFGARGRVDGWSEPR